MPFCAVSSTNEIPFTATVLGWKQISKPKYLSIDTSRGMWENVIFIIQVNWAFKFKICSSTHTINVFSLPFLKHFWHPQHDRCWRDSRPRSNWSCDVSGMQHLHLATFLPPGSRLWMWQKQPTHPVPHIPFLNVSVQDLFESLPLPFVLFGSLWWTFQASSLSSPRPLPGRAQPL